MEWNFQMILMQLYVATENSCLYLGLIYLSTLSWQEFRERNECVVCSAREG